MKRKLILAAAIMGMLVILAGCGSEQTIPEKLGWEVQDFEATDQDGETVALKDLKGEVWIADFVFTNCNTVCPPMTANMVKVQKKLQEADVPVKIISFSVDPERDTPEIRKNYIKERGGKLTNWSFVGGYKFDYVKNIAEKSFKTGLRKPGEGTDQFTHGTSFFLVDHSGTVVKRYNGYQDVPYEKIVEHAKILTKEGE